MKRTAASTAARRPGKVAAVLACTAVMLLAGTGAAHAAPHEFREPMLDIAETGHPGLLTLTSSVYPLEVPWLEAGNTFSWQIGLHLTGQPIAEGSLEFIPEGGLTDMASDYRLTAQRCETQWTGHSGPGRNLSCPSTVTTLLLDEPLQAGPTARIPFGDLSASASPHILFTLSVPEGAAVADPFTFALGFTVMGDGDQASRPSSLPVTGFAIAGTLAAGMMLLAAGLVARLRCRRAGRA